MTRNGAQAYGHVAKLTANPRELEASLLLRAAARLQAICDGWDGKQRELDDALVFNRKLWSIFLTEAEANENPNSLEVRQNIANIGIFVLKQTIEMHGGSIQVGDTPGGGATFIVEMAPT